MTGRRPGRRSRAALAVFLLGLLLAVAGGCPPQESKYTSAAEVYDPSSDTWALISNIPFRLAGAAACQIGGRIYLAGGATRPETTRTRFLFRYDPMTDTWERLEDMQTWRSRAAAVALGTELYVLGGLSAGSPTESVEIFDTVSETWSSGPSLLSPRVAFGATDLAGRIYIIGGISPPGGVEEVEFLDPSLGVWQPLSPLPAQRTEVNAETDGILIYAISGVSGGASGVAPTFAVDIYDPGTDTWTPGPSIPFDGVGPVTATIGSEIFVSLIAGPPPRKFISLDVVSGLWTVRASHKIGLDGNSLAATGGLVYSFGGTWRER